MNNASEKNTGLVLEAFDTLFNKRDCAAAEKFWSPHYIQTLTSRRRGKDCSISSRASHDPQIRARDCRGGGQFVIIHWRFSGCQPTNWIAADIRRIKDGVFLEHWDMIQDEATKTESKSGLPMFGEKFTK